MLLHGLLDIVSPNPMTAAPLFRLVDLQFRTGWLDWKEPPVMKTLKTQLFPEQPTKHQKINL